MQMKREAWGAAWLGVLVAFAACSGKTTNNDEFTDAGSGGSAEEPSEPRTGGTDAGGAEAGGTDTGGRSAAGGSEVGGTDTSGTDTGGRPAAGGAVATGGRTVSAGGDATSTGGNSEPIGGADPGAAGADTGTGGDPSSGGESGALFGCGPFNCVEGKSYCYNFTPGNPSQASRAECKRLTEDCSDCACLCPSTQPDGQCSVGGGDASGSCLCGGEPGKIVISCFGG